MTKQKIILLTPLPFWHPGTKEYISGLQKYNFSVVAVDIWNFLYYTDGKISDNCPGYLKGVFRKIYCRINRKKFIKHFIKKENIVDIQWVGHYYLKYMKTIAGITDNIIITPFGSDVLRANEKNRLKQKEVFRYAKAVVLGKNWTHIFLEYFPETKSKLQYNQYGSARYDQILSLWSKDQKAELRKKYKISDHKRIVTVGYNANPVQQHDYILKELSKLSVQEKKSLVLLFPLTYGASKESEKYQELIERIKNSGFEYLLFEQRLSDLELCEIRILSDIMVNLQTTDTQASSIKEGFAARNVLIVGDWLPYDFYRDAGVYYISTSKDQFITRFKDVIQNFDRYLAKVQDNYLNVSEFASWNKIIPKFVEIYKM